MKQIYKAYRSSYLQRLQLFAFTWKKKILPRILQLKKKIYSSKYFLTIQEQDF